MADIDPNFTCSDPDLSHSNVTAEVWMIKSEGPAHEHSIIAIAIFQILFVAIGIPWNAIVLATILIKRLYREPTYILLLNLVVADFLVCVCVMPFNIASAIAQEFTVGNSDYARCQVCHTIVIIIISLVFVSLFTLALMSVDRLIYIKWPLNYSKHITVKVVLVLLLVIGIFCILVSILPVFGIGEIKFANVLSSCSLFTVGETRLTTNINYVVVLVFVGLFPFMTTLIANIWLLVLVCRTVHGEHSRKIDINSNTFDASVQQRDTEKRLKSKYQKQQIRLAQVFGGLFIINIITWAPTIFISFVSAAIGAENVPPPAFAFVFLAYVSQPAIHPMLETCLVGKARNVLLKCLCCCCRKYKRDADSSSATPRLHIKKVSVASSSSALPTSP